MTLFNIVTFDEDYNFSDHNVMAQTWLEAFEAFVTKSGDYNIDSVEYARILMNGTTMYFIDGALVPIEDAPELPDRDIRRYVEQHSTLFGR